MGCSSCGSRAAAGRQYPYEAVMPDGSRVTVSSAAMERVEREKARSRLREQSRGEGYRMRNS